MLFGDVSGHKKSIGVSLNSYLQVLRHRQTPNYCTNGMTHTYTQVQAFTSYLGNSSGDFQFGDFQVLSASKSKHSIFQYVFTFRKCECMQNARCKDKRKNPNRQAIRIEKWI